MARPGNMFDTSPFIVFWETTRACDLACRHCRASAIARRDPLELTTAEGKELLDELRAMGVPVVVLTGGDPAKRPDLVELVRHGSEIGLRMALTPSATPLVTPDLLGRLKEAGLARLAISLDGAQRGTHDGFRGERTFDRTLDLLCHARQLGLTTQLNTTVSQHNLSEIDNVAAIAEELDIELWAVFFVVPTGRATDMEALSPEQTEQILEHLAELAERSPFDIKTTAAPHFRRVLLQRKVPKNTVAGLADGIGRAPRGVNDGQGIAFVSNRGDVYPSGFLPVCCGNVRDGGLTRIYRLHPFFRQLRDPEQLGGKCGVCEFRRVCGGSRARAHATTGDALAADPACAYEPRRWSGSVAAE